MLRKPDNIEATPDGGRTLIYKCPACGNITKIGLTQDEARELFFGVCNGHRKPIQDILPDKTPDEREVMMTGLCPDCQDAFLAGALDDDEEA